MSKWEQNKDNWLIPSLCGTAAQLLFPLWWRGGMWPHEEGGWNWALCPHPLQLRSLYLLIFIIFIIEAELTYSVMFISGVQRGDLTSLYVTQCSHHNKCSYPALVPPKACQVLILKWIFQRACLLNSEGRSASESTQVTSPSSKWDRGNGKESGHQEPPFWIRCDAKGAMTFGHWGSRGIS